MIRNIIERIIDSDKRYIVSAGLSSDLKPTEKIITGSKFIEVDTGMTFLFDEMSSIWFEFGGGDYSFENWTTDTGDNITDSDFHDISFRVMASG